MISYPGKAMELNLLNDFGAVNVKKSDFLVHLFITENCSVCNKQIEILTECIASDKVAAYIEGTSEEKLRTYIKRKKIPFKTFHLNESAKKHFGFGKQSPSITLQFKEEMKKIVGLQDCDQINSIIRAGSSDQHK